MNVYRVIVSSEKPGDGDMWTLEGCTPTAAIRYILNRSDHMTGKNIIINCILMGTNKTIQDWRKEHPDGI